MLPLTREPASALRRSNLRCYPQWTVTTMRIISYTLQRRWKLTCYCIIGRIRIRKKGKETVDGNQVLSISFIHSSEYAHTSCHFLLPNSTANIRRARTPPECTWGSICRPLIFQPFTSPFLPILSLIIRERRLVPHRWTISTPLPQPLPVNHKGQGDRHEEDGDAAQ